MTLPMLLPAALHAQPETTERPVVFYREELTIEEYFERLYGPGLLTKLTRGLAEIWDFQHV